MAKGEHQYDGEAWTALGRISSFCSLGEMESPGDNQGHVLHESTVFRGLDRIRLLTPFEKMRAWQRNPLLSIAENSYNSSIHRFSCGLRCYYLCLIMTCVLEFGLKIAS